MHKHGRGPHQPVVSRAGHQRAISHPSPRRRHCRPAQDCWLYHTTMDGHSNARRATSTATHRRANRPTLPEPRPRTARVTLPFRAVQSARSAGIRRHWYRKGRSARGMTTGTPAITGDDTADALVDDEPLTLLPAMLLDQQIPMEWAFESPSRLAERLGGTGRFRYRRHGSGRPRSRLLYQARNTPLPCSDGRHRRSGGTRQGTGLEKGAEGRGQIQAGLTPERRSHPLRFDGQLQP